MLAKHLSLTEALLWIILRDEAEVANYRNYRNEGLWLLSHKLILPDPETISIKGHSDVRVFRSCDVQSHLDDLQRKFASGEITLLGRSRGNNESDPSPIEPIKWRQDLVIRDVIFAQWSAPKTTLARFCNLHDGEAWEDLTVDRDELLKCYPPTTAAPAISSASNSVGRPPTKRAAIETAMRRDLAEGYDLQKAKGKELADRYDAGRTLCCEVRKRIIKSDVGN